MPMIARLKSVKGMRPCCIPQTVFLTTLLGLAAFWEPPAKPAAASAAESQADPSGSGLAPGAPAVCEKGPLAAQAAEQVRAIVMAQIKVALAPAEDGGLGIFKFEKGRILSVMIADREYSARVFCPFSVPFGGSTDLALNEYYVQTTGRWQLGANTVIPADTYLTGIADRVSAYDAEMIAAQEASLAQSEGFYKEALDELAVERKAEDDGIAEAQLAARRNALLAAFQSLRRRIFAGETLSKAEMWSAYQSALAAPANPNANILPNADFARYEGNVPEGCDPSKEGWQCWSFDPSVSEWRLVEVGPGRRCFMISNRTPDDTHLWQNVRLAPNAVYEFSARIKTESVVNAHEDSGAELNVFGPPRVRRLKGWPLIVKGTQDWRTYKFEFTTPPVFQPNESRMLVECSLGFGGAGATGKAWFDELSLKRIR